jgi:hypothetical protein
MVSKSDTTLIRHVFQRVMCACSPRPILDRTSGMQVAQYLNADLTALAARFWAPGGSASRMLPKRCEQALACMQQDLAWALWSMHPAVQQKHDSTSFTRLLDQLPAQGRPAACSTSLEDSPDGATLLLQTKCAIKLVVPVLAQVRNVCVLKIDIPGTGNFTSERRQARSGTNAKVSRGEAASEACALLHAAMKLLQPPLLHLHCRVAPPIRLFAQLAPRLRHLSIAGSWAVDAPWNGLPASEQLQQLSSLEWHSEDTSDQSLAQHRQACSGVGALADNRAAALRDTLNALPRLLCLRIATILWRIGATRACCSTAVSLDAAPLLSALTQSLMELFTKHSRDARLVGALVATVSQMSALRTLCLPKATGTLQPFEALGPVLAGRAALAGLSLCWSPNSKDDVCDSCTALAQLSALDDLEVHNVYPAHMAVELHRPLACLKKMTRLQLTIVFVSTAQCKRALVANKHLQVLQLRCCAVSGAAMRTLVAGAAGLPALTSLVFDRVHAAQGPGTYCNWGAGRLQSW